MKENITKKQPNEKTRVGNQTVQIYNHDDGSKTVTIGNRTGLKNGGNFGGKGRIPSKTK